MTTSTKWVYTFAPGNAEGRASQKALLGGKGANLAEMCHLNLPVPAGFTISTEVCTAFYAHDEQLPAGLEEQVTAALTALENVMERRFGDAQNPLLVSVRSGAPVSMPGMMDTVLNLGLNDTTVQGIIQQSGDARFAYDSYRRFIQMYADVVLGVPSHLFEDVIRQRKGNTGCQQDTDLKASDWQQIIAQFKTIVLRETGSTFPEEPTEQLWGAIKAVFQSWNTPRAVTYRNLNDIPHDLGTAVNVQAMVFGNMGNDSATGVMFTRNPAHGDNHIYGEYMLNAQGEDLVAGIRTPHNLRQENAAEQALEMVMPEVYQRLAEVAHQLEAHYQDMQDVEFTVQQGKLWFLQTRAGKRTAAAALKIATDMVDEGLIDKNRALQMVEPKMLDQLLHPTLDPKANYTALVRGLPASPGAAVGKVVFSADAAEKAAKRGEQVILVRAETSPEDVHGMAAAVGILTAHGGMTSHAAVVARGMGKPCICGVSAMTVHEQDSYFEVGSQQVKAGDVITLDGTAGNVILGALPMVEPELSGAFARLMAWADRTRTLGVRANADTPRDVAAARRFGAEGIGLCRTEHMFFEPARIPVVRQMILATTLAERQQALDLLAPMQKSDFEAIFKEMAGLPVTIRLLDPPLHEFLPHTEAEMVDVAKGLGIPVAQVQTRTRQLHEANPMLGHRGCRLGITYPEIYEMQARAIFEAAAAVVQSGETAPDVEVMVPLVGFAYELAMLRARITHVAEEVMAATKTTLPVKIGTMLELPRACLTAAEIAQHADFFSFGTNDLTQTALGLSRDDSGSFLPHYLAMGVFEKDPFESLDQNGVGQLVKLGVAGGRQTKPELKLGVCGEHGGDPASIGFFHTAGLDYVSCSPFRVPIARLAAAQAALKDKVRPVGERRIA